MTFPERDPWSTWQDRVERERLRTLPIHAAELLSTSPATASHSILLGAHLEPSSLRFPLAEDSAD
jgi:hypothetical protein